MASNTSTWSPDLNLDLSKIPINRWTVYSQVNNRFWLWASIKKNRKEKIESVQETLTHLLKSGFIEKYFKYFSIYKVWNNITNTEMYFLLKVKSKYSLAPVCILK